ncbi:flagellar hook-length control protein FliK [Clostridium sp. D2Q-11]|uniref:Flagellar hook-length control protein FliK n=1 Tax=Anaeromonas frigoriresistens TaxID=2683708 RepID=A0A942V2C1_9FIRM|nr:flagellar hook-length control protein FliK [Anaeromonas frigoriresistens]MBS4539847.1 flagellar hook-length control protein FliK [Anaeromonas frigoriresistens]
MNSMIISTQFKGPSNNAKEKNTVKNKDTEFNDCLKGALSKNQNEIKNSKQSIKEEKANESNSKNEIKEKKSEEKIEQSDEVKSNEQDSQESENIQDNIQHLFYLIDSIIEDIKLDKISADDHAKLQNIEELTDNIKMLFSQKNLDVNNEYLEKVIKDLDIISNNLLKSNLDNIINTIQISENKSMDSISSYIKVLEDLESIINEIKINVEEKKIETNFDSELVSRENKDIDKVKLSQVNSDITEENKSSTKINDIPIEINKREVLQEDMPKNYQSNYNENDNSIKSNFIIDSKVEIIDKTATKSTSVLMDKFEVINQIKEQVVFNNKGDIQVAKINLKPESLGEVTINLSMQEGSVTGKVLVENQDIKALLENNINQLKEAISSKGINIEGFSVSVGKDSQSHSNNNFFSHKKKKIDIDLDELSDSDYIDIISNNYQEAFSEKGSLDITI